MSKLPVLGDRNLAKNAKMNPAPMMLKTRRKHKKQKKRPPQTSQKMKRRLKPRK